MFAATVTLLAIYLLLHYSTRDLFACDLPDIYLVQAEHIGSRVLTLLVLFFTLCSIPGFYPGNLLITNYYQKSQLIMNSEM